MKCEKEKEIQAVTNRAEANAKVLDELKPLIPMLKEIVEEKKAQVILSKLIVRILGYIAPVVGILAGILAAIKYGKEI